MASFVNYPLVGFHFLVVFDISPVEVAFQEVSGLNFTVEYKNQKSGGLNSTTDLRLPVGPKYENLVLKRGYGPMSGISAWVINAVENYNYLPTNIMISLLDEEHLPVSSWYVVNALPVKWEISGFNAEDGKLAIESLTLTYDYFKTLSLSGAVAAVVNAIESINAAGKISVP